ALLLLVPASPIALTRSDGSLGTIQADEPGVADGGQSPTPFGAGAPANAPSPGTPTGIKTPTPTGTSTPSSRTTSEALIGGPTPTPSPTAGQGTPTASPTKTPTATPAATAQPTSTPPPTPTVVACLPSLSPNTPSLTVVPGGTSFFLLLNGSFCADAPFSVQGNTPWLSVSPSNGNVGPFGGGGAQVNVAVDASKVPAGEGTFTGALTISGPGGSSFTLPVTTFRGGGSPTVDVIAAQCTGPAITFDAFVTDDLGVSSVVVNYVLPAGTSGHTEMSRVSGNPAGGTWSTAWSLAGGLATYEIIATDFAGHAGRAAGTC
ncbi:MAG: hypothetical protein ABI782_11660, partial [Anaerolineaceae bacterium]